MSISLTPSKFRSLHRRVAAHLSASRGNLKVCVNRTGKPILDHGSLMYDPDDEAILRFLQEGYRPRRRGRQHDKERRRGREQNQLPEPIPIIEEWLTSYEELLWQRLGKRIEDQRTLSRLVHEYESAGLNVQQARAWLDAGLHLWDPKTAGELQAAGISPKIAFRPMKSQGKQTDLTIYRMVSSGQWTVEDALDLVERSRPPRAS